MAKSSAPTTAVLKLLRCLGGDGTSVLLLHIRTRSREGELHAAAHVCVEPSPPLEPACCWCVFLCALR